jgi:hypothetical protein
VALLALVAMFFDHLLDVEEGFPADPVAFAISAVVVVVLGLLVFGVVVPRTKAAAAPADRAGKRAFVCGLLALVSVPAIWLGLPFVVAGGAITLGLLGREGANGRLAVAGLALGALVLVLACVGTDWGSES